MQNFLKFLLFFLLVITSCENTEEHQPSGTIDITISTPGYIYLDDWWDYASKYEIYINNKLEKESSFNNFEVTSIDTEVGVHKVLCAITDAFGVWLYVMEKPATVQEDSVTDLYFDNFYIAEYPTADYSNEFTSLDGLNNFGGYEIVNSKLYASPSTDTNKQLEWNSSGSMTTPIRVAIDVESTWDDSIFVGVGLGNSSTNDYHMFFLTELNISLMRYDGASSNWTTINQWATTLSKSGTMLMVFDTDYFWCHLNDVLVVWGESYEVAFDIVNIFHWGKNSAYFDNLRVYNSNAVTMEIINDNKSIKLPFPY